MAQPVRPRKSQTRTSNLEFEMDDYGTDYIADLAAQDYADFGDTGVQALGNSLGYSESAGGLDWVGEIVSSIESIPSIISQVAPSFDFGGTTWESFGKGMGLGLSGAELETTDGTGSAKDATGSSVTSWLSKITPDAWAKIATSAIGGMAGSYQRERDRTAQQEMWNRKLGLDEQEFQLRKQKQENAMTSMRNVKPTGLIQSNFFKGAQ